MRSACLEMVWGKVSMVSRAGEVVVSSGMVGSIHLRMAVVAKPEVDSMPRTVSGRFAARVLQAWKKSRRVARRSRLTSATSTEGPTVPPRLARASVTSAGARGVMGGVASVWS